MNQLTEIFDEFCKIPVVANSRDKYRCGHICHLMEYHTFYMGFEPESYEIRALDCAENASPTFRNQQTKDTHVALIHRDYMANNFIRLFGYHKAASVEYMGQTIIMDPLFPAPLPIEQWAMEFQICMIDNTPELATKVLAIEDITPARVQKIPTCLDNGQYEEDEIMRELAGFPNKYYSQNLQKLFTKRVQKERLAPLR